MTPRTPFATRRTARLALAASVGLIVLAGTAQAASPHHLSHDGFVDQGDHLVFVGQPAGAKAGKSRSEVHAELQAARLNPSTVDGWRQEGDSLRYVGVHPAAGAGKTRMRVLDELAAWRANPVHPDGWVSLGDTLSFQGVAMEFQPTSRAKPKADQMVLR